MMPRRVAFLVLILSGVAAPAAGQEDADEPSEEVSRRMYVGAFAGPLFDAPLPFSESAACPAETTLAYGGRLGLGFGPYFAVEGTLTIHADPQGDCTVVDEPAPDPENGTRVRRLFDEGVRGYPFGSDEVRAIVRQRERPGTPTGRLIAGAGWLWQKDTAFLLAGAGARYGGERLAATLDVEQWWYSLTFVDVEETFAGGELVEEERTTGKERQSPVLVRIGVNWRL